MGSATLSESHPLPVANRRVIQSCFWSTLIFSTNFVSSILVINLAKWYSHHLLPISLTTFVLFSLSFRIYVKHNFPNLTLTTINLFVTFFLLLFCMQARVFTFTRLPILHMIPISACFGGFIALSNLSLQYNTVGTYQLIKLQVTPST